MKGFGMAALAVGAVFAWTAAAHAGPCTTEISQLQVAFDAKLNAAAAGGPAAPESTAATMHRQPTLNSVAGAEERLGDISPAQADAFNAAMKRAREADAGGDRGSCERALDDAGHALGR